VEDIGKRDQDFLISIARQSVRLQPRRLVNSSIVISRTECLAMAYKLIHGTVVERPRKVIHIVRVLDEILEVSEIDDIAEKMRDRMLSKFGEPFADIVVVQGTTQDNLRLFGDAHTVSRVRAALFNAAVSWSPITLD
jgi:hypothetical protein